MLSCQPFRAAVCATKMLRFVAALACLVAFPVPLSAGAPDADGQDQRSMQCSPSDLAALFRLARKGDRDAQFAVATLYGAGDCLQKDKGKQWTWLRSAANRGHAEALFMLAAAYYLGEGFERNVARASRLFQRAAEFDHAESQHYLGMLMLRKKDRTEAEKFEGLYWLGAAATNGHALSALVAARLYENGKFGISKDTCLASDWYEASYLLGLPDAKWHLARLKRSGGCPDG